ncbi:hypothetical protein [Bradyrhizobium sp. RDT46]|uniref:hypothetical protein n=1 Tax=Bradyrhizobium sp. RDT46 TaxID=3341829 RepID=UPI0035C77C9F
MIITATDDRINPLDLRALGVGEAYVTWHDQYFKVKTFHAFPEGQYKNLPQLELRANHFIPVSRPSPMDDKKEETLPLVAEKLADAKFAMIVESRAKEERAAIEQVAAPEARPGQDEERGRLRRHRDAARRQEDRPRRRLPHRLLRRDRRGHPGSDQRRQRVHPRGPRGRRPAGIAAGRDAGDRPLRQGPDPVRRAGRGAAGRSGRGRPRRRAGQCRRARGPCQLRRLRPRQRSRGSGAHRGVRPRRRGCAPARTAAGPAGGRLRAAAA